MGTQYSKSRGTVQYTGGPGPEAIRRADATPDRTPGNGYAPLAKMPSPVARPAGGDRRGGTADLAGGATPFAPPNDDRHRFDLGSIPDPTGRRPPEPNARP